MNGKFFASLLVFCFFSLAVSAQEWETFGSEDYNIKVNVPANWKTSTGTLSDIPYLEATSPDETVFLFVYVYKDASISTLDLLHNAVTDLGVRIEDDPVQENLNGMDAYVANCIGIMEGQEVYMFVAAATYDENNYVAYIFTSAESAQKNVTVMNKIIDSLSPMH